MKDKSLVLDNGPRDNPSARWHTSLRLDKYCYYDYLRHAALPHIVTRYRSTSRGQQATAGMDNLKQYIFESLGPLRAQLPVSKLRIITGS